MTPIVRHPRPHWRRALACALLASQLQVVGCVAIRDEDDDMTEIPRPPVVQKPVPTPVSSGVTDIVIVDMREEPGPGPSLVTVVGTVINRSNEDVGPITVRVEGRDAQGRTLTRVTTSATPTTIAASGGTSTFEASLPRTSAIHDYHAEIVAR